MGYLAYVVSGHHDIYVIYREVYPVVGAALFLLSVFTVIIGILQAQARTVGLAVACLIGCWGISVPMSYMLGIHWDLGIMGLWYGIMMGYVTFALFSVVIFFRSKWIELALEAVQRSLKGTPQSEQGKDQNQLQSSLIL